MNNPHGTVHSSSKLRHRHTDNIVCQSLPGAPGSIGIECPRVEVEPASGNLAGISVVAFTLAAQVGQQRIALCLGWRRDRRSDMVDLSR
eukprot:scaffold8293_cov123-Isochrysis_galbana.AAC.7